MLYTLDDAGHYRPADPADILAAAKEVAPVYSRGRQITEPTHAVEFLQPLLQGLDREHVAVVYLTSCKHVLETVVEHIGGIGFCTVAPGLIARGALLRNAAAVLLAHNHPSGVAEPSEADRLITRRVRDALDLIEVELLDHLIIGDPASGWRRVPV